MKLVAENGRMIAIQGDITRLSVDVIVNAANGSLLGGSGVDGAIHRAAGRELYEECRTFGGCLTGDARITEGYRLPAGHIVHAVGPIWRGGHSGEDVLLTSCYRKSLTLAAGVDARTIAFPAISCGVYRFPVHKATQIAINEVRHWLAANPLPEKVIFCCFTADVWDAYEAAFAELPD